MFLIGIAGGSGSGKTTFARKVLDRVREAGPWKDSISLLSQDSYYLPETPLELQVHGKANFDHPEAFDWPLLRSHLAALRQNEQVLVPVYDYKISRRLPEVHPVGPSRVVVMEGIYTLWDESVRNLMDLRVYLHVEADIRFIRRLHRDVRERGRSLDGIISQYYDTVRPMHRNFLEPTQQYADLIVGEETDLAADVMAARVLRYLESPET
jgi:uridine kinase